MGEANWEGWCELNRYGAAQHFDLSSSAQDAWDKCSNGFAMMEVILRAVDRGGINTCAATRAVAGVLGDYLEWLGRGDFVAVVRKAVDGLRAVANGRKPRFRAVANGRKPRFGTDAERSVSPFVDDECRLSATAETVRLAYGLDEVKRVVDAHIWLFNVIVNDSRGLDCLLPPEDLANIVRKYMPHNPFLADEIAAKKGSGDASGTGQGGGR